MRYQSRCRREKIYNVVIGISFRFIEASYYLGAIPKYCVVDEIGRVHKVWERSPIMTTVDSGETRYVNGVFTRRRNTSLNNSWRTSDVLRSNISFQSASARRISDGGSDEPIFDNIEVRNENSGFSGSNRTAIFHPNFTPQSKIRRYFSYINGDVSKGYKSCDPSILKQYTVNKFRINWTDIYQIQLR